MFQISLTLYMPLFKIIHAVLIIQLLKVDISCRRQYDSPHRVYILIRGDESYLWVMASVFAQRLPG